MTEQEEAELMRRVMEDSTNTHDERQWVGLDTTLALSVVDDATILELEQAAMVKEEVMDELPLATWNPQLVGQQWGWSNTVPEMVDTLGVGQCSGTPSRSPKHEQEPWEEVLQTPLVPLVSHELPAHLWQPSPYVDLISDDNE
ncbi:hypothetical protein D1007_14914 [Hordeum vulgare]|nr:hypothetical protein D1007_14914 [Hordeum vulgare]